MSTTTPLSVSSAEAKNRLSELVALAEAGVMVEIMRRGVPVAWLVKVPTERQLEIMEKK